MEMQEPRSRNGSKLPHAVEIGLALEFDGANEVADEPTGEPGLHQRQQPLRVAHDIAEQPIHRSDRTRVERECALAPDFNTRQRRDARVERCLVDTEHAGTEAVQYEGPAARAAA